MRSDTSKGVVLLVATMASFIFPFMGAAVIIALPTIGKELSLDAVMLGWIATAFLLVSASLLVPFGRIADIHGRKRVFTCGIVIFTVASLLSGMASSATMLISFRVLQGIGAAMIAGTGVAIVTSVFPADERGKALGINVAAVYAGLSLGPVLGGILTQHFGWRSIFFVNVLLGLIVIAVILWKLKGEWAEAKGERFDFVGSIIYSLALVALIYGFTLLPAMLGVWLIVAGVIGFSAFARWEMKATSPVLDINLFRNNRVFIFSNLAVAMPAVQAIFSPVAGRLSDKIEPRIIASAGMAVTTAALVLFIFLNGETPLAFIIANLILLGFGLALFSSPNTNAVMSSAPTKAYGVASATVATMRQVGMVFSMGVAMLMFALYIGRVQITPAHYPFFLESMQASFIIFAILCFGGIFASLARGKVR